MTGMLVLLSTATLGIDYGWQPVAGGGIEYIIQIEPQMIDALLAGEDIASDLPSSMRNVRSYRITVGSARLPHHGEPLPVVKSARDERVDPPDFDRANIPLPGPDLNAPDPDAQVLADDPSTSEPGGESDESDSGPALTRAERANADRADSDEASDEIADEGDDAGGVKHTAALVKKNSGTKKRASQSKDDEGRDEAEDKEASSPSDQPADGTKAAGTETRPWGALSATLLGLFASLGGNAYLIWLAAGLRRRCRSLLATANGGPVAALPRWSASHAESVPHWEEVPDEDRG